MAILDIKNGHNFATVVPIDVMCLHTCTAVARLTLALAKLSCSSSYTTSGDIFYWSGSRQLNHSSFFLFFCPSRYDARHRKPRRFVYALKLGDGHKPPPGQKTPPDSFSFRSSFSFNFSFSYRYRYRSRSRSSSSWQITSGPGHPTSGDIFYCSGSG